MSSNNVSVDFTIELLISRTAPSPQVTSEQLVMLLELLLEQEELSAAAMRTLKRTYDLQNQDAEVRPHTLTRAQTSKYATQLHNPLWQ